jgi:hypothetical protein
MTRRSGHRERSKRKEKREQESSFDWIPLWGWVLIFMIPLLISEFMFWNVGKIPSMIIFPIAWIGFWYAIMERSGWPILKNQGDGRTASDDDS